MATVITFGSEYTYNTNALYNKAVCGLTDTKCIEITNGDGYQMSARIGTINGTVITWGSAQQVNTEPASSFLIVKKISSTRVIVGYRTDYHHCMFTIDENNGVVTANAVTTFRSYDGIEFGGNPYGLDIVPISSTKCITVHSFGEYDSNYNVSSIDNTYYIYTINSNGTFSYSTGGSFSISELPSYMLNIERLDDNSAVIGYSSGNSGYDYQITRIIKYTTSWSVGAANTLNTMIIGVHIGVIDSTKFYLFGPSNSNAIYGYLCTISGTTITYSSPTLTYGVTGISSAYFKVCMINGSRDIVVFTDGTNSLTNGKATTVTNNGSTVIFDTIYTFNTVGTQYVSTSALSNNAFIVIYSDKGNSNRPTGIIGTMPALGKKINNITYVKWNNTSIAKWNNQ